MATTGGLAALKVDTVLVESNVSFCLLVCVENGGQAP